MKLDRAQLETLSAALRAVKRCDVNVIPRAALAQLTNALPAGVGITIDFDAGDVLGHPIVVLRPLSSEHSAADEAMDTFASLTAREREVAGFVATGLRNKDIAIALDITLATVKDHVHRILRKSGLDSRTAMAVAWNESRSS